jgi:hypothetical protein
VLRIVVLLLLIANAVYFAWTSGWLTDMGMPPTQEREPERLKTQLDPGTLRLLNGPRPEQVTRSPAALSAAAEPTPSAPPVPTTSCWQASGFTLPQADALRNALGRAGLASDLWQLNEAKLAGRWVVFMGRYNDEQMAKKKAELRELKIEFREVNLPSTGPGLALGTFSSEEAVQQALRDVAKKGVRSARAAVERPELATLTLRLPSITTEQRSSVEALGEALAGKSLQSCE